MIKFTRAEIKEHNSNNSAWIVIDNKVYDVTKFLDEHPGGCEVLLEKAGEDRTEAFEDIGHSTDAREIKEQYLIGEVIEDEKWSYSNDKQIPYDQESLDKTNRLKLQNNVADFLIYGAFIAFIGAILYYLFVS